MRDFFYSSEINKQVNMKEMHKRIKDFLLGSISSAAKAFSRRIKKAQQLVSYAFICCA